MPLPITHWPLPIFRRGTCTALTDLAAQKPTREPGVVRKAKHQLCRRLGNVIIIITTSGTGWRLRTGQHTRLDCFKQSPLPVLLQPLVLLVLLLLQLFSRFFLFIFLFKSLGSLCSSVGISTNTPATLSSGQCALVCLPKSEKKVRRTIK